MRCVLAHIAKGVDGTPASPAVDHLGLASLAGVLAEGGHDVSILDTLLHDVPDEGLASRAAAERPDIVGYSVNYSNVDDVFASARELRRLYPHAAVVAGGSYATFHCDDLLSADTPFHGVVLGDGEMPFLYMANAGADCAMWCDIPGVAVRTSDGIRTTNPKPGLEFTALGRRSYEQLSHLARFPRLCYRVAIESSRGCAHSCSFCSIAASQRMAGCAAVRRLRSPTAVADEVRHVVEAYDLRDFWFMDADFLGQPSEKGRVLEIARRIAELGVDVSLEIDARADAVDEHVIEALCRAGLQRCFVGVESFDDATLKMFGKKASGRVNIRAIEVLEKFGVRPILGMIMFHPQSTLAQLRQDHAMLRNFGYEKTQMLFRLKKYKGSRDAGQKQDSDGRGVAPWEDYGWEFDNPEIAEAWKKFDALRLEAMDEVFVHMTHEFRNGQITPEDFSSRSDAVFRTFGENVDAILG